jgi:hypothetical protein
MTGKVGVAISTVGNRPELLERAVNAWISVGVLPRLVTDHDRIGVAACKNAGIARLMDLGVEHLFLADDDVYPLNRQAWKAYVQDPEPHLMLCWGEHRLLWRDQGYAEFKWPRGVLLYAHRSVIETVGGMRTEFGTGGHEHVEWSRRIYDAGLTMRRYADLDRDPREFWHAEDMPRPGERPHEFANRKRRHTTIRRTFADKRRIAELWERYEGSMEFVPYE